MRIHAPGHLYRHLCGMLCQAVRGARLLICLSCPRRATEMKVVAFIDPRAPERSRPSLRVGARRGEVIERILRGHRRAADQRFASVPVGGLWRAPAPMPPPDVAGVVHDLSRLLLREPDGRTHLRGHGHLRGDLLINRLIAAWGSCVPAEGATRSSRPERSPTSPQNSQTAAA